MSDPEVTAPVLPGFPEPSPRPRRVAVRGYDRRPPHRIGKGEPDCDTAADPLTPEDPIAALFERVRNDPEALAYFRTHLRGSPRSRRARASDPDTSHEAAASITLGQLRARQRDVLHILAGLGGSGTDEEIAAELATPFGRTAYGRQSPSGIRTRRAELVERGLVVDSQARARTASNRRTTVWELTPLGRQLTRGNDAEHWPNR